VPNVSTNFTSTIFAPASLAIWITLLGVLMFAGYGFCLMTREIEKAGQT
jgi:hypothetical protein